MTAREEFNRMLNACHDPIGVYNVLSAIASSIKAQNAGDPRAAVCQRFADQEVNHA